MRIWKSVFLFSLGGSAYTVLELLWRGRSHGSMFALGGICFVLIGQLQKLRKMPLALLLVLSAGLITGLELVTGLLVNRDYSVWDYRQMPYHYLGQICLNYSLLWIPVSFVAILFYRGIASKLRP